MIDLQNQMNDTIMLSVVIPVFNVECFLSDCINSVIQQHFSKIEIILIDDGSTDKSSDICDAYASKYEFVRTIHKRNEGISIARNLGLSIARGKYICFVDSDDLLVNSTLNRLVDLCELYQLDVVRAWYSIYDNDNGLFLTHDFPHISFTNKIMSGFSFLELSVSEKAVEVVPWLGLYRRNLLLEYDIRFPDKISYEEDHLFFLKVLVCTNSLKILQTDLCFYTYRKRTGSATKTPSLKQIEDILYIVNNEKDLVSTCKTLPSQTRLMANKYISASFYQLTSIYGRLSKNEKKVVRKKVPFILKLFCLKYSYDVHQGVKLFLFTFCHLVVDIVYYLKKRKE